MVGKARIFSSDDESLNRRAVEEQYALGRNNDNTTGGLQFGAQEGFTPIQQTGLLDTTKVQIRGSQMAGPLGFGLQLSGLNVATDTLDIARNVAGTPHAQPSVYVTPILSAGSTTDLVTILGQKFDGQLLILNGIQGNTITIKNTAGAGQDTILTPGGVDFLLRDTDTVSFIFDVTSGKWRITSGSGGSAIIINGVLTTVDPSGAINVDVSDNQHFVFELNANITITFIGLPPNLETSEQIVLEFIQDIVGGRTVGYSQTIAPSVPAIDTTAGIREVVTGFIRRDDVGVFVFNLYLVGN